ncbi:MAG TPA: hypothetical protein VKB71_16020, partial [Rhizomicrobium sp.]|nr:hypothetical protein [Rhizomicrobium sp.]
MTASRAEFALALAVGLFASAAAAQAPASGPPATLQESAPAEPASPPPSNSSIEVNPLGAPEGPALGLLDATTGGMADDIWSGSARGAIEEKLLRVPLASPVRSIRGLSRKLVLTKADAPPGQAPHAFLGVRIQVLLNAGLVAEAAKLAAQADIKDDPEFARLQAEAILLGGGPADACGNATLTRNANTEPFWMQLRAYCYAVAGNGDLLEMTRGVMKSEGADDKPFETLLDDVLTHKAAPPGDIHEPTAVDVFLMRQAGIPINANLAAKFGLAASVLTLRDAKNPPAARAEAAAQALHAGAATPVELASVADAQSFTSQQFANAANAAAGLPFFMGQALIRQSVAHATNDDEKVKLLAVAFRLGRQNNLLPVAAALQARGASAIKPTQAMRSFAPAFAQALLLARQADAAERWREILDVNNPSDKLLAAFLAAQLDLVATNPGRAARAQEGLAVLSQNAAAPQPVGGSAEKQFAALTLGLYDALGLTMPADARGQAAAMLAQPLPGRHLAPATM